MRTARRQQRRAGVQGHEFSRAATVHKLLQDTPASEAEWILYMDPQTMLDAPTVVFNFEFYAGRDIVLACDIWLLKSGETGAAGWGASPADASRASCVGRGRPGGMGSRS